MKISFIYSQLIRSGKSPLQLFTLSEISLLITTICWYNFTLEFFITNHPSLSNIRWLCSSNASLCKSKPYLGQCISSLHHTSSTSKNHVSPCSPMTCSASWYQRSSLMSPICVWTPLCKERFLYLTNLSDSLTPVPYISGCPQSQGMGCQCPKANWFAVCPWKPPFCNFCN